MLPLPPSVVARPHARAGTARTSRGLSLVGVLTLIAAVLALVSAPAPATAAQATGDDVPVWSPGWSWTYQQTFNYVGDGANVTLNETVTYTVAGIESFQGQSAYRLTLSGTITGGGGNAAVDGVGNVTLQNFSGSVSGTRFVRRSDLALLQESQQQSLNGQAKLGFLTQGITADINFSMTPTTGWRAIAFPVEAGQSWTNNVNVAYDGGFSYSAGSIASGNDTFAGEFGFSGPSTVSNETISVPAGSIATRRVHAQSPDGQTVNTHWYSPTHRYDARQLLQLPIDGGSLGIDQRLSSSSTPAPSTTLTSTITPSLSCAGGDVAVAGRLSTGATGVPVTVSLDRSPVAPGQSTTVSTTTTSGGNYTATLTAPAAADGLQKTGARASWGVLVSAGGATAAATLVVTPENCTRLVYNGATGAAQGTDATVSATLTDLTGASTAGRTVTFTLSGGAQVQATTNASGVASTQIPVAGPVRNATVATSFAGGNGLVAASDSDPFAVETIPTSTAVVATPPVVTIGDPVRFTATVTPAHGGTPTGSVQFKVDDADFGAPVALSGGTATSPNLSTLGLGFHTVRAVYAGSADHTASGSAEFTFRVREPLLPTTVTATADPGTAVYGQPVTLGARVTAASGTPTGTVRFTVGGTEVAAGAVDAAGDVSVVVDDLPVGSNQVVATYSGDDVYDGGAAAPRNVTVTKADVSVVLVSTDTSTVTGEPVGFSATVSPVAPGGGTPQGTAQLVVDGSPYGDPVALAGGSAVFGPLTTLGAGDHTVAVTYGGSADHQGGSDSVQQTVAAADTTTTVVATPSPSVQDENVELRAAVVATAPGSGAPTGTVNFFANGDLVGSAPLAAAGGGAEATLDVSDLAPGDYQVTARYAGDSDYRSSESAPISHTVIAGSAVVATTTSLSSSENPSTYGGLITFTAQVAAEDGSTPAGRVQFSVDGQDVGDPVAVDANGRAESASLASPDPGDHTVIAAFLPETGFTSSGDVLTQTVEAAGVELMLSSSDDESEAGQAVTFSAAVDSTVTGAGTPTGFVQFVVDGQPLGDAVELVDGEAASAAVADLAPGQHRVTAIYSGDVRFAPALAEITQRVLKVATTTSLQVDPASSTYGDPVTLRAQVTPAAAGQPGGVVEFRENGTVVATAPVDPATGVAVATVTPDAGTHEIRAFYLGDPRFEASASAPRTATVAKRSTSIRTEAAVVSISPLGLPLGQLQVTLTGGGQPLAGQVVRFKVGNQNVCASTTDARGIATCNAAAQLLNLVLSGGYVASYAGDANHLPAQNRGVILK